MLLFFAQKGHRWISQEGWACCGEAVASFSHKVSCLSSGLFDDVGTRKREGPGSCCFASFQGCRLNCSSDNRVILWMDEVQHLEATGSHCWYCSRILIAGFLRRGRILSTHSISGTRPALFGHRAVCWQFCAFPGCFTAPRHVPCCLAKGPTGRRRWKLKACQLCWEVTCCREEFNVNLYDFG